MNEEPTITINGVTLNNAQAMVVREAVASYHSDMQDPDALGDDPHGRRMTVLYREHMDAIIRLMVGKKDQPNDPE